MTYKVQLPVFEGPLDLLLYLIKKEELNIYDIPIARITGEYLEYMDVMKLLDLEIAGEFILMAATLMHIKSKMLLPVETKEEEVLEKQDPREELVRKLLEYKKFKEAAGELNDMRLKKRDSFTRLGKAQAPLREGEEVYFEASLFDLITAFSKVLKEVPKGVFHKIVKDEYTVSDKIHEILHRLVKNSAIYFSELFKNAKDRGEVVAIFLALLELVKVKEVIVKQKAPFAEIELIRNAEWQKR
jgi:segregation and condensation protein A